MEKEWIKCALIETFIRCQLSDILRVKTNKIMKVLMVNFILERSNEPYGTLERLGNIIF